APIVLGAPGIARGIAGPLVHDVIPVAVDVPVGNALVVNGAVGDSLAPQRLGEALRLLARRQVKDDHDAAVAFGIGYPLHRDPGQIADAFHDARLDPARLGQDAFHAAQLHQADGGAQLAHAG